MVNKNIFLSFSPRAPADAESITYGNIMYDRRIVRGNTYAQHTLPAVSIFFRYWLCFERRDWFWYACKVCLCLTLAACLLMLEK